MLGCHAALFRHSSFEFRHCVACLRPGSDNKFSSLTTVTDDFICKRVRVCLDSPPAQVRLSRGNATVSPSRQVLWQRIWRGRCGNYRRARAIS